MVERRNGQHPNHPHPDLTERAEQIAKVWEGRRAHKTYAVIGEELGMSATTARKLFREGYKENMPPAAEEYRALMLQQYEELLGRLQGYLELTLDPKDLAALMSTMLRAMKGQREMLGLDSAKRVKLETTADVVLDVIDPEFAKEFAAFLGPREAEREAARRYRGFRAP